TSRDGGGSWGPPRVFDADTVQFSYAAPVEVFPGVAAVPYALERGSVSGSLSALYLRYLIDSPAASPIGDSFVDPSARVAARPRQVLAFDDFDRPDQDVLERSPSGAAWVSSGALAVKGGELRTTGAGVFVAYVTLADGDHEVEADVKWVGNTGPSVLFRGVDASTYLMASVEGAGSYVRLYKVEGGVATQLGAATEASRSGQWVT